MASEGRGNRGVEQEFNNLYSSPKIVRVIKSRRLRWAGHVEFVGIADLHTGFFWGNLRKRDYLEDPGLDGRIILRWIFRKWDRGMGWIDLAQDKDRWRTLVNAVMNILLPYNVGIFLTS